MRQKTLLKIIGLLRKNLDEGRTILEISRQLKIGYRPAYNHICAMEKENLVTVKRVGNAKQSFLNLENIKTRHLLAESDMLKKEEICKNNNKIKVILESLISKLTEKYISDIQSIILFGSYAKGKATKQSDIDLLFIISDLKKRDLRESIERECASYQYAYNIKLSPIIADVKEFKRMLDSKELNIGKEAREHGISLYGSELFWRLIS